MTIFAAASAVTYSRVAGLPHVYPKHDYIKPKDWQYFIDTFFGGKRLIWKDNCSQLENFVADMTQQIGVESRKLSL